MKKTICINFDHCVVCLPKSGGLKEAKLAGDADMATAALKKKGWKIFLKTALDVEEVKAFCKDNDVKYDAINEGGDEVSVYMDTNTVRYSGSWKNSIWDIAYFKPQKEDAVNVLKEMTDRLEEGDIWKRGKKEPCCANG